MEQQSLSCVKDMSTGILPASFSLQSVDLLPTDEKAEPKVCCLTLRNCSNGHLFRPRFHNKSEIRVLHGNNEVHNCIKEVLIGTKDEKLADAGIQLANPDGIWNIPFRIPLSETKTTIQVIHFI